MLITFVGSRDRDMREPLLFPCYFLFFPVPDPAISAYVIAGTHFFAGFGCRPAPFTGIYRQGKANGTRPDTDNGLSNLLLRSQPAVEKTLYNYSCLQ